ncbi:hypothetical protein [Chitinophaga sp. 212800010-3]|uniref:hypothetical protein n=1 Tax=unclassified Chitinophaga TaxID=2619133 RepID=UPI002DEFCE8F|nr:HK97 gp10 family phage protein [Chitinophaga sp. 212800010-3]
MYVPVIILILFLLWYARFRVRGALFVPSGGRKPGPVKGEDAIRAVRIVGVSNSTFAVSKYLRSVRNTSDSRFITLAVDQVITTAMGTTHHSKLMENLAPGEERRLGHSDHVREGKYQIFIGYEILWARYVPAPEGYSGMSVSKQVSTELLRQHQHSLIREMEDKSDLLT